MKRSERNHTRNPTTTSSYAATADCLILFGPCHDVCTTFLCSLTIKNTLHKQQKVKFTKEDDENERPGTNDRNEMKMQHLSCQRSSTER